MDDTNATDNVKKISAFSKRFYTLRATTLLKELIRIVNDFNSTQQNLKILSKHTTEKRHDNYLSNRVLTRVMTFSKLIKQQAEKLLLEIAKRDGNTTVPPEQEYIDRLTVGLNENNHAEKIAEIKPLLHKYAVDLTETPEIYNTRLIFSYNPSASSSAFNNNIDQLREASLLNPLNETTLLNNQSFDMRQLLTFDDYRLYLLKYYFKTLRADLSRDNYSNERHEVRDLTPFDLLFNPKIEITYSPRVLAILHFQQQTQLNALTSFITNFKKEAHRLLNESGELVDQINARVDALQVTLTQLKSRQNEIESSLDARVKSTQRSPKRWHGAEHHRRTTKIQEEITSLKRQRALIENNTKLLNDYHRIAKLYVDVEKQFLHDLANYLLKNTEEYPSTPAINHLREKIAQDNLTIKENPHQFRATEKQTDPHFREKPFETQNNQYTNYRKLWMDIIDTMFRTYNH